MASRRSLVISGRAPPSCRPVFPGHQRDRQLYGIVLGHRDVTAPWGTGGLVWVLVTAAAYLAVGIAAFQVLERAAKARGSLARYGTAEMCESCVRAHTRKLLPRGCSGEGESG